MITIHLPTINKMIRRSLSAGFFPGFLLVICENVFEKEWNLNGNSFSAATSVYHCFCLPTTLITSASSYSCSRSCYFLRWPFDPVIRILEKRSKFPNVQFSASLNFRIFRVSVVPPSFHSVFPFPQCLHFLRHWQLPQTSTWVTQRSKMDALKW